MKIPRTQTGLATIAIVAGYSLVEVFLLLTFAQPSDDGIPTTFQFVIFFAQLLLIPGIAALFSVLLYGTHQWRRRTLTILACGPLGVSALIASIVLIASVLAVAATISMVLFFVALPVVVGGLWWVVAKLARRISRYVIELESKRRLTEIQSGIAAPERKSRARAIGWALWIPALLVLLIGLFLPEAIWIVGHMVRPSANTIGSYRIPVPAGWIIGGLGLHDSAHLSIGGVAMSGIGRHPREHIRLNRSSLSLWYVGVAEASQAQPSIDANMPRGAINPQRRVFKVRDGSVVCVEYGVPRPDSEWYPMVEVESRVSARCAGPGRLYSTITGSATEIAAFYKMLQGVQMSN